MREPRRSRARASGRRRRAEPRVGHDRWLVSYADLITLLFGFFAMMYAVSSVDARTLGGVVSALQHAFAAEQSATRSLAAPAEAVAPAVVAPPAEGRVADVEPDRSPESESEVDVASEVEVESPDPPDDLQEIQTRLLEQLQGHIAREDVDLEVDRRGLVISIREAGSFPVGSAELSSEAQTLVQAVGGTLAGVPNHVRIEGHTDDSPIRTARYASNWELSTARATTVVAYLVDTVGVEPERLSAAGYGEFHPRASNAVQENRARNRRVDIVILNAETSRREERPIQERSDE